MQTRGQQGTMELKLFHPSEDTSGQPTVLRRGTRHPGPDRPRGTVG